MGAPLPADVRAAIDAAREADAVVQIDRVASDLAQAFHDEGDLIKLMLKRVVMAECRKFGLPMRVGG
ncbi:hypothetical protein [Aureimonas sp. Leaf454]|uniref:hypothetical protein n=1 Tax=Aureimonas sp. Leaf454 TaxID=1736381 RepID=UPI000A7F87B9|nr:hypothetical protein [Aureimonas sp. Leaf454]